MARSISAARSRSSVDSSGAATRPLNAASRTSPSGSAVSVRFFDFRWSLARLMAMRFAVEKRFMKPTWRLVS